MFYIYLVYRFCYRLRLRVFRFADVLNQPVDAIVAGDVCPGRLGQTFLTGEGHPLAVRLDMLQMFGPTFELGSIVAIEDAAGRL